MKRSGTADLPLHGGRVPQWLAERMTKLGTAIAETIIYQCTAYRAASQTPRDFPLPMASKIAIRLRCR